MREYHRMSLCLRLPEVKGQRQLVRFYVTLSIYRLYHFYSLLLRDTNWHRPDDTVCGLKSAATIGWDRIVNYCFKQRSISCGQHVERYVCLSYAGQCVIV